MMNPRDVEHIALLARIALTEKERDRMGRELSAILVPVPTPGFVQEPPYDKVGWHTSDTHPLTLTDVRVHEDFAPPRPDAPDAAACLPRKEVLAQAPEADETSFLVPPVVDTR